MTAGIGNWRRSRVNQFSSRLGYRQIVIRSLSRIAPAQPPSQAVARGGRGTRCHGASRRGCRPARRSGSSLRCRRIRPARSRAGDPLPSQTKRARPSRAAIPRAAATKGDDEEAPRGRCMRRGRSHNRVESMGQPCLVFALAAAIWASIRCMAWVWSEGSRIYQRLRFIFSASP